jgi:hypothetical protein
MTNNLKIEVICKLNQARSVIAEEFIRSIFENVQINSSGVSADESARFPGHTLKYLAESSLSLRKPHPDACKSVIERLRDCDLLIFSEDYMHLSLSDSLVEMPNFLSLESPGIQQIMRSTDPVGMDYPSFKIEITKNLTQSITLLNRFLVPQRQYRLICVVPNNESAEFSAFEHALKLQTETGGMFISLNYRSKEIQKFFPRSLRKVSLSSFVNLNADPKMSGSQNYDYVVTQDHEEDGLQNLVMSSRYRTAILRHLDISSIIVFTEPIRPHGTENTVAIFSCVYADEVITIY